jgi:hypothetical protein
LTCAAGPLTNSWFPSGDGEKRPPANVVGAHGWPFGRESPRNGETRKWRQHGQLRSCGRRGVANGWVGIVART